ncbi:MAG TPA: type II toxin-antitoxin system antitoxin SocA domain-containing protein [Longimicrobium sp.]|nr:type II toxin-antitoxin system antitoxin SocA domain-containing protein [Longimicrobium sp.]
MVSAHDVAAYILREQGPLSAMKLQKLVYYAQAWSLVWDDRPLFHERIEAWVNGPVVRELYERHKGRFELRDWPAGNPEALDADGRATVHAVLGYYGGRNAQTLSDMTHAELPWREARHGLSDRDRGAREITLASLAEYYGSLPPADAAQA